MDMPQSLAHKGGKIQHVHAQIGTIAQCECGIEGQTPDRILCTCPMYQPATWTTWSGRVGRVDEEVAARRLPRHLI